VSNPFREGSWAYKFWQDGWDNYQTPSTWEENEFAQEQWEEGKQARIKHEATQKAWDRMDEYFQDPANGLFEEEGIVMGDSDLIRNIHIWIGLPIILLALSGIVGIGVSIGYYIWGLS